MPFVKSFVNEWASLYNNLELKYQHGADPVLHYLNADGQRLFTQPLSLMTREEIDTTLLTAKAVTRKPTHPLEQAKAAQHADGAAKTDM